MNFEEKEKGFEEGKDYCTLFPDTLFGVNYSYACYLHDREYRNERKVRRIRKEADKLLKEGVIYSFNKQNKLYLGILIANLMYFFERMFGWKSWVK
jgi:hypothetical protein